MGGDLELQETGFVQGTDDGGLAIGHRGKSFLLRRQAILHDDPVDQAAVGRPAFVFDGHDEGDLLTDPIGRVGPHRPGGHFQGGRGRHLAGRLGEQRRAEDRHDEG